MDVIVDRCAGLDVHKKTVMATVRSPGEGRGRAQVTREFLTFTNRLVELRDWLVSEGVTQVAMEATGVYWRPVWHVLEDAGFELLLVNPAHFRNLPGRKTDVADSEWLAQLLECGLLRGSFIPPADIAKLRDLTRYRTKIIQERVRETQRIQKLLEDADEPLLSRFLKSAAVTVAIVGCITYAIAHPSPPGDAAAMTAWDGADPAHASSYQWLLNDPDGSPTTWACGRIIRWVYNPAGSEPGALDDLRVAMSKVTAASGIVFVEVGTTDMIPTMADWKVEGAELIVVWATPEQTDFINPETGSHAYATAGPQGVVGQHDSGTLVVAANHVDDYADGFGPTQSRGGMFMHELGHVVGLNHTEDTTQIMAPLLSLSNPAEFGSGDLAGLQAAGACV